MGLGVSPLRGAGLLRCASSHRGTGVSPLDGLPSLTRTRPGRRCRLRHAAALSRARGSRALLRHAARDRRPLGDRTGLQVAALGARAPARSPPRSPAKPGAGPLKTGCIEVLAAARPPRQSLACGSLGGTSAAEAPLLVIVRSAALQPLRQASWHIGRDAAPPVGRGQPVRQSSHRAPPTRPRRIARGTCGGIFKRWAGKPAHCFGC